MILALKKDKIRVLKEQQAEYLGQIREVIEHSGDIVNKVHLFENKVKIEDKLSTQKIITVLVKFGQKMETTLGEMWKLLPGSSAAGLSRPSVQETSPPRPKEMSQKAFEEMKARI